MIQLPDWVDSMRSVTEECALGNGRKELQELEEIKVQVCFDK